MFRSCSNCPNIQLLLLEYCRGQVSLVLTLDIDQALDFGSWLRAIETARERILMAKAVQGEMQESSTKYTRWGWEQQTETDFQAQRHRFGRSLHGYSRDGNSGQTKLISTGLQHDYSYKMCGFPGKKDPIRAGLSCYLWKRPKSTIMTSV